MFGAWKVQNDARNTLKEAVWASSTHEAPSRVRLMGTHISDELTQRRVFATSRSRRPMQSNTSTASQPHNRDRLLALPSIDMHTSSRSVTLESASIPSIVSSQSPSSVIHTLSRSVFPEIASVPPVAPSDLSQSVFPKNANHPVPVQVLEGHENTVLCICFCAENIVSGSVDHTLRIWDQKTGATQVLIGHTDTVDVSQDGKMRSSVAAQITVRI
ncbi:hypothetical protein PAXINDRAFT_19275 [Paxillus involutus ATCC 200175]|uniref:Uncharacterized protein n=1 Tax=Paxillus involutus ATCC 200175 TaxID=664439 RepID=A0A0C9SX52_PAXIN|nr:hypothetical protein PAXINDRAFT_19275 [Paxillus involutus ATCC 200175]